MTIPGTRVAAANRRACGSLVIVDILVGFEEGNVAA
jgi:hypothetical protein